MTLNIFTLMKQALVIQVIILWSSLNVKNRMDRQIFDYSMKNVPIPSEKQYQLEFLNSIHIFSKKAKWRALKHFHPEFFQNTKETFHSNLPKSPQILKNSKLSLMVYVIWQKTLSLESFATISTVN